MTARVLVIEDDELTCILLQVALERNGFTVVSSGSGQAGVASAIHAPPDLIVLDVGLPDISGWAVLERLRTELDVPILMLTSNGDHGDRVRGLHAGADDYLVKPCDHGEFVARVEALLRRRGPVAREPLAQEIVVDGALEIDTVHRAVRLDGADIAVTPIEFRLLHALFSHRGRVLSPDQLLQLAWGDHSGISPERVKFSVHRLRRKLGWTGGDSPIQAVRGFGYRYRRAESR